MGHGSQRQHQQTGQSTEYRHAHNQKRSVGGAGWGGGGGGRGAKTTPTFATETATGLPSLN